jgi:UDP-glucuronate decarboxylase
LSRIVVTGGAGFIGSNLVSRLIEHNHIIAIDNLLTGSIENIMTLLDNPRFTFIEHDITVPIDIAGEVDKIYDLACPASPVDYRRYPLETMQVSSKGVHNMLELAKEKQAKYLFTSTSEVYGDPLEHPQTESYWGNVNPIGERSCYDEGKRFAESLVVNYRKFTGIDAKIVRIFNTYGPMMRGDDGRVVSNFIVQALRGSDLAIYGDGNHTRSFCYATDMVGGIIRMMASEETGPINLGNPVEITISSLADTILEMTGSSSKITYKDLPQDDPTRRSPDISLARVKLGWEPTVDLEEGLLKTIHWFETTLGQKGDG